MRTTRRARVTRVAVIVPAHDAAATLAGTLDGLAAQDVEGVEVVVVDDGSTDGTARVAAGHPLGPTVVRVSAGGAGAARNAGAAATEAEVLAFTDADCVPAPGWLRAGLAALEDADFVQGTVLPAPGVPIGPYDRTLAVTRAWGLYESANVLVRRAWFERVGGFDEWLRVGGRPFAEDMWFGWRLRRAGARMTFAEDALVHHAVFPGTAREFVGERWRDGHFAAAARRVPELRDVFFHRRIFLSPRSAAFDLALAGVASAALARTPLPLLAAVPYARRVRADARRRSGRAALRLAAVHVAADAVGFASLVRGSVAARTPLL